MLNYSEYPSKLPPGFVKRTIAKLLPSLDAIRSATPQQRRELLERKLELERAIALEPIRFFEPNPGAQADFMIDANESIRSKFFLAGNKSGKSTAAAILAAEYATGEVLWGRDYRPPLELPFSVPNRGVYYADDFDSHKQTTLPTLLTWLPHRWIKDADRNSAGHIVDIYLTNGSTINFRTYDQGYDKSEGKDWSWGVCDEPPPRDIYTGIRRGLVVYDGIMIIAATLLREPWIWDEVEQRSVRVYSASITDNHWIPENARDIFISSLTTEEREIRVHGRPITLSGVVYKDFRDDAPWVVPVERRYHDPVREVPWPVVMGVDPHERKPIHIIWFWLTPGEALRASNSASSPSRSVGVSQSRSAFEQQFQQFKVSGERRRPAPEAQPGASSPLCIGPSSLIAFDYALIPSGSLNDIFAAIAQIESEHDQPTTVCVMDPNRGTAKQIGGRCWADEFGERGFEVMLGDDSLQMGHADVRDMLRCAQGGQPRLMFQENLRGKGGPIYALTRYAWDDWTRANRLLRDPKEKVREQWKDFPDIIRYVSRAVITGQLDFDVLTSKWSGRNRVSLMRMPPAGRQLYS